MGSSGLWAKETVAEQGRARKGRFSLDSIGSYEHKLFFSLSFFPERVGISQVVFELMMLLPLPLCLGFPGSSLGSFVRQGLT